MLAATRPAAAPGLPGIVLRLAHPAGGLGRLGAGTPYWAFAWAGGLALARHVTERLATVAGRRVLDLGAGSGVVGIAAAKVGAASVTAAETDPHGRAAIALNAAANGVAIAITEGDLTAGPPPAVDLVLAGDVFYDPAVAEPMAAFLGRCAAAGIAVLVGDPGRRPLPRALLEPVAEYEVADFGAARSRATVFAFRR